jgi:hypothetical protein
MADKEDNWKILPKLGLGRLQFGARFLEIEKFAGIYGNVDGKSSDRISDSILRETLEQFGDDLTAEEKQEISELYEQKGPSSSSSTEVRGAGGLVLGYEDGRLSTIMMNVEHNAVTLDNQQIFSLPTRTALLLIETLNRAPGRYRSTQAAFDNISISLDGFSDTDKNRLVSPMLVTDERFANRTVELRAVPYLPADELDKFVKHSFL